MSADFVCLHNKLEIERFLRKNIYLHLYSIGDLDDFFWPYTTWYGLKTDGQLKAVVLVYTGLPIPTVLAISEEYAAMEELLKSIEHLLPFRFYSHLSPGLENVLNSYQVTKTFGEHYKMALSDKTRLARYDGSGIVPLHKKDLDEIQALYLESYPGNWFDPRMLETKQYFGLKEENQIVSIAGIHVYSPQYKVAALGNITTLPAFRNRGYGKRVTVKLCQSLLQEGIDIGLNVKSDNLSAINCYEKIGFEIIASYGEYLVQRNT